MQNILKKNTTGIKIEKEIIKKTKFKEVMLHKCCFSF